MVALRSSLCTSDLLCSALLLCSPLRCGSAPPLLCATQAVRLAAPETGGFTAPRRDCAPLCTHGDHATTGLHSPQALLPEQRTPPQLRALAPVVEQSAHCSRTAVGTSTLRA